MKKKNKLLLILPIILTFVLFSDMNVNALTYTPDEIPARSYVIGEHLFTRKPATGSPYPGTLTTQWIMYASSTIMSSELDDRIIYYKDSDGVWVNAINEEELNVTDEFYIQYIDGVEQNDILVPTLAQDMTGPDVDHLAPEYTVGEGGKVCTNLHINSADLGNEVDGFVVYNAADDAVVATPTTLDEHVTVCENPGATKTYYAKTYREKSSNNKAYSEKSNNLTINFNMDIMVPTLAQDMTGPDGDHQVPEYNFGEGGKICTNVHVNSAELENEVDGFIIYNSEGDAVVATPTTLDEHVELCGNSGTTTTYYAKTYIEGPDNSKIYSEKSNNLTVDFTIEVIAPTLAQDMTGPDGDHLVPEYTVGEGGKVCTTLHINSADLGNEVDGFVVYNASDDAVVATPAGLDSHVTLCENQGTTKTYYAKTYIEGPDHSKIYSEKSNNLTINFNMDIMVPTLAQDMTGPDGDHQVPEYNFGEGGKICTNVHVNSAELENEVDGFIIYNSEGDAVVATPTTLDEHVELCGNSGTTTTYYAKTYIEGPDNSKIYSEKSNNLTVDFTIEVIAPTLAQDMTGPDGDHLVPEYTVGEGGKICTNVHVNSAELENEVNGFVIYNVDGDAVVATPTTLDEHVELCGNSGTTTTYYAKTYIEGPDHSKIYSEKSNNLTITFNMD